MRDYIHPNFNPTDKHIYLCVVKKLRDKAIALNEGDIIYVSQNEYDILENASHPTMKGEGHHVYGIEIKVYNATITYSHMVCCDLKD